MEIVSVGEGVLLVGNDVFVGVGEDDLMVRGRGDGVFTDAGRVLQSGMMVCSLMVERVLCSWMTANLLMLGRVFCSWSAMAVCMLCYVITQCSISTHKLEKDHFTRFHLSRLYR